MASDRAQALVRSMESSRHTYLMGVINCTPDSFYPKSRIGNDKNDIDFVLEQKPDLIDLGAESTRPGSLPVEAQEQIDRLGPVIRYIRSRSDIPISIDTRSSEVARIMVDLGADMINDVSALEDDPRLFQFIIDKKVPVILMHKQGDPVHMQLNPKYERVVEEVIAYLTDRASLLEARGLEKRYIFLDPGLGFGKTFEQNQAIISNLRSFVETGYKIVFGHSRKAFIGRILGGAQTPAPVEERGFASAVLSFYAAQCGVSMVRVHDIGLTREALSVDTFVKGGN